MHPRRLADFAYLGPCAYFLPICTANRARTFADPSAAAEARAQFLRTADAYGFEVIAYCLMPDHLHALVAGAREDADFRRFVAMFKQRSGFAHRRATGSRLWQENYYEHVIGKEEAIAAVAGYVLGNPLRAGLVERAEEYRFMGSGRFSLEMLGDCLWTKRLPWNE